MTQRIPLAMPNTFSAQAYVNHRHGGRGSILFNSSLLHLSIYCVCSPVSSLCRRFLWVECHASLYQLCIPRLLTVLSSLFFFPFIFLFPYRFLLALYFRYDLNDPWGAKDCYEMSCCWNNYNESKCTSSLVKRNFKPTDCNHYCSILQGTQVFMGGTYRTACTAFALNARFVYVL